jgi:hypothetical protein
MNRWVETPGSQCADKNLGATVNGEEKLAEIEEKAENCSALGA